MWTYFLIGLAAVVVIFLGAVAMRPGDFRIARSATMNAPPAEAFALVNDFRKWTAWSPWERMDPNLQRDYGEPSAGLDAVYSWVGNKQVGEGRMTIVESRPNELIRIKLEFLKPFKATHTAEFQFEPVGRQTEVTWAMTGVQNFCFKAICMFVSMDKMVGRDFERGLANMKAAVEAVPVA